MRSNHKVSWILGIVIVMMLTSTDALTQFYDANYELIIGPEIRTNKRDIADKIIGKDENGYYTLSVFNDKLSIFYFDNRLNLQKQNKIRLEYKKETLRFIDLIAFNGEFYLFTANLDRKHKISYLYRQKMNKDQLTFSTPEVVRSDSYDGYSVKKAAVFELEISYDFRYLLVVSNLPTSTKKNETKTRFGLSVYDSEMNLFWKRNNILINEPNQNFEKYEIQVGVDGNAYLLAKIFDTSVHYRSADIDYTFKLMVYDSDTTMPVKETDVTIIGQHVTDISFKRLGNKTIQVVAFYSPDGLGQNGVVNLVYSADLALVTQNSTEFPIDYIIQYETNSDKRKAIKTESKGKNVQFNSFEIHDLIENSDQSVTLIAEQYLVYTSTYTYDNGGVNVTNHYLYGNIMVIKFNRDGEVEWMELIPKDQSSVDKGYYSGYSMMQLINGNLVFVFNDNPKNSYVDQLDRYYTWLPNKNNTDVVMYEITDEGRLNRHVLYKSTDEEVMSRPQISVGLGDNEMLIIGESRKAVKFAKLIFD